MSTIREVALGARSWRRPHYRAWARIEVLRFAAFRICGVAVRTTIQKTGAGDRGRTCDLLITNQLLYQLSYAST